MTPVPQCIVITCFERLDGAQGARVTTTWADLAAQLEARMTQPHDGAGWSPAAFKGDYRNAENVEILYAIGLDLEPGGDKDAPDPLRLGDPEKAAHVFADCAGIVHTTRSHSEDSPRCRVVLHTDRPMTPAEYEAIWQRLRRRAEAGGLRCDPAARDAGRFWFTGCAPASGAPPFFARLEGAPLAVDSLLEGATKRAVPTLRMARPIKARPARQALSEAAHAEIVALVVRHWPAAGRHEAQLALSGCLCEAGIPQEDAADILASVCEGVGQADRQTEAARGVRDTYSSHAVGRPIATWRALGELLGRDAIVELRSLLGSPEEYEPTDVGNAARLVSTHGGDLLYVAGVGWHVWDGRRFARDEVGRVTELAKQVTRDMRAEAAEIDDPDRAKRPTAWALQSQSAGRIDAMVRLAASDPRVASTVGALDANPWLLNTETGTIDLRTGDLGPHRRADRITKLAAVAYDPAAGAPTWRGFLTRFFAGDTALIAYVQRAIGYALTGKATENALFFCYGSGANGKSTLLETTLALLGDYAQPAPPRVLLAKTHEQHPTEIADFLGARLVSVSEIGQGERFDEERVKHLTGNDTLKARRMRGDFFSFAPTHKIWVAANDKPEVRGTDEGIWRRMHLIPFAVTIPEGEREPGFGERLRATELPGILRWAVEGCLAWQREGLSPPTAVLAASKAYRAESDVVARWIEEACERDPAAEAQASELHASHLRWAREQGVVPVNAKALAGRLAALGFSSRKSSSIRWQGIRVAVPAGPALALVGSAAAVFGRKPA